MKKILITANSSLFVHQHLTYLISVLSSRYQIILFLPEDKYIYDLPAGVILKCFPFERNPSLFDLVAFIRFFWLRALSRCSLTLSFTPKCSLFNAFTFFLSGYTIHYFTGIRWQLFRGYRRVFFRFLDYLVYVLADNVFFDSYSQARYFLASVASSANIFDVVISPGSLSGVDRSVFKPRDINYLFLSNFNSRSPCLGKLLSLPQHAIPFVFGYVGRICVDKGILVLLHSFKEHLISYPDSFLVLVGPLELGQVHMDLLFSAQNVVHIDFVDDTSSIYSVFDCYVSASFREGFGSSLLEAMSCGLPVISTDISGPRDFVFNSFNGVLVMPEHSCSLLSALNFVVSNPSKLKQFSSNALSTAAMFDSRIVVKSFQSAIDYCLD